MYQKKANKLTLFPTGQHWLDCCCIAAWENAFFQAAVVFVVVGRMHSERQIMILIHGLANHGSQPLIELQIVAANYAFSGIVPALTFILDDVKFPGPLSCRISSSVCSWHWLVSSGVQYEHQKQRNLNTSGGTLLQELGRERFPHSDSMHADKFSMHMSKHTSVRHNECWQANWAILEPRFRIHWQRWV